MNLSKIFGETAATDWRRPSVVALVVANLIPVFGVVFLHWKVFPLMFLFWSENVIIGFINVLKMILADPKNPAVWAAKLFLVPFFCVHYGMFTFIHGIFVVTLFGQMGHAMAGFPGPATFWQVARENDLGWAILGLAVSRGISFATNYLRNGEFERAGMQQLMSQPYSRVVVLHLTILFGGFVMMALHSPAGGLLLLVALKIAVDLRGHFAERRKFATAPVPVLVPATP